MSAPGKLQAAAWMGLLGLLLAATGCSDSNEPGGGNGDLVSQQIGPQGGTVRSADGQLTLIFPAGAVTQTQTITIEPLAVSQLGSEFSALAAEIAYDLGPDGLAFQQPVTVSLSSNQEVQQPDGSLKVSTGLLLTSAGGQPRVLANLRLENADGSLVQRGELSHFSPIVYTKRFVTITVTGIPDEVVVGTTFTARVNLAAELIEVTGAFYDDDSFDPLTMIEPPSRDLERVGPNVFDGSFSYTCTAVAEEALYSAEVFYDAASPVGYPGVVIDVGKGVKCVAPPSLPTLTVTKTGSGTGTVTSNPAGISCGTGDGCTEQYVLGTGVALTATPDAGSVFVNWSGACPGGSSLTTVVVDADKTCTAQFDLQVSTIELLHRRVFESRLQGTALNPADENTLVAVGADGGGDLDIFDITNPRAPMEIGSRDDFCEGALSVFFADPSVASNPTFIATSTTELKGCVNQIPPGPGTVWNYDFAPGGGAWIPGTSDYLLADFSGGRILRRTFMGGTVATIPLGTGQTCPFNVVVSGDLAFVVGEEGFAGTILDCATTANLFIINLATNQLLRTVDVGSTPRRVVVSPDRVRAYVTDFGEDEIYVVNIASGTVETTFVVGDGPVGMAMSASGAFLVVVGWEDGFLHMINPLTGDVLASIDTEQIHPVEVFLTDDDQTAVVTGFGDEEQNQGGSVGLYKVNTNF